jgi:hypothetical protein
LPKDVPKHYFHHEKGVADKRSRVTRFLKPVTVVRQTPAVEHTGTKEFVRAHISFQSTGATNISTVNAINSNMLYLVGKERGIGEQKRRWAIEMNVARFLYLKTFGHVDTIDALIKHCHMGYQSMKYWHSAMIEGVTLAVVVAYDMYLEAASGVLFPEWKVESPMDFHTFRDCLSSQALQYQARNQIYPGDELMRACTLLTKQERKRVRRIPNKTKTQITARSVSTGGVHCFSAEDFKNAKKAGRICDNLTALANHLATLGEQKARIKSGAKCAWCGDIAFTRCTICKVPLHNFPAKGAHRLKKCSVHWHDPECFGLAFRDTKTLSQHMGTGTEWVVPSKAVKNANRKYTQNIVADL